MKIGLELAGAFLKVGGFIQDTAAAEKPFRLPADQLAEADGGIAEPLHAAGCIVEESPVFINELINCGKYVAGIFCILGHSYRCV